MLRSLLLALRRILRLLRSRRLLIAAITRLLLRHAVGILRRLLRPIGIVWLLGHAIGIRRRLRRRIPLRLIGLLRVLRLLRLLVGARHSTRD